MKVKEIRNHRITRNCFGVNSVLEDGSLIEQKIREASEHKVDKKFRLISNFGYFNRITNFIVGNKNSILFLDTNGEMVTPTIEEVKKNSKKYFMMYPIPCKNQVTNNSLNIKTTTTKFRKENIKKDEYLLTFENGLLVGDLFFNYNSEKDTLNDVHMAINGSPDNKFFWPNKSVILNSNQDYALGILIGYLKNTLKKVPKEQVSKNLFIKKSNNIYIFALILNWLGAIYKIRNIDPKVISGNTFDKQINILLPFYLYERLNNLSRENIDILGDLEIKLDQLEILFKKGEYFWVGDIDHPKKSQGIAKVYSNYLNKAVNKNTEKHKLNPLNKEIQNGKMVLLPCSDFNFIELKEDDPDYNENLYDLTTPRADATNYSIGFTPIMKNSDGDILTLSAVFGKQALVDAKEFAPMNKAWFKDLNTGNISQYISDDALLGLWAVSKHI